MARGSRARGLALPDRAAWLRDLADELLEEDVSIDIDEPALQAAGGRRQASRIILPSEGGRLRTSGCQTQAGLAISAPTVFVAADRPRSTPSLSVFVAVHARLGGD